MSYYTFKPEVDQAELQSLTDKMKFVFCEFVKYCEANNLECLISCIHAPYPGRISKTHEQYRAVDFSSRNWSLDQIQKACDEINASLAKDYGAFSLTDGVPRCLIYHKIDGGAFHFHLQCRP
jgi:hypothetical protein